MIKRVRPTNYIQLLAEAVDSARLSKFWGAKLEDRPIASLTDFSNLPFTPVEEYRGQTFESVLADADGIEWIPGAWLGQSPDRVPVAEGPSEANLRVELMADAIRIALPERLRTSSALVIVPARRRHFGAEVCAVLVRMGVQAHLLVDEATDRLEYLIQAFDPDIVVALSNAIDTTTLPGTATGVVTAGRGATSGDSRRIDLCVQSELGVLGAASGSRGYEMNHHRFHFEESPGGTLAVTPYFSRVQPLIRLVTGIPASVLH